MNTERKTFEVGALVDITDGSCAYWITPGGLKEYSRKHQEYNPYRVVYTGKPSPTPDTPYWIIPENDALVHSTVDGSYVFTSSRSLRSVVCPTCGQEKKR